MGKQQDTQIDDSRSERYLLSGLLLVGGLLTGGGLQLTLLAASALLFGFTYRVGDETLVAYLIYRARTALSPEKRRLILLFLEVAIPRVERVAHHLKTAHAERVREQRAEELVAEFLELTCDDLQMDVPPLESDERETLTETLIEGDGELTPETTFEPIAESVFDASPRAEIEARLVTVLTLKADRTESSTDRHDIVTLIDRLITGFSFYPVDDEANKLLTCYEAFRLEGWAESKDESVFDVKLSRSEHELASEFLREYSDEQRFKHILKNNRQIEELRSTLADLVRSGKLDVGNIHEDVIREKVSEVEEEINQKGEQYSSYILISSKLITEGDEYGAKSIIESKFPTIKLGTWDVQRNNAFEEVFLSTRLVYTSRDYPDATTFLDEEIKPLLPSKDEYDDGAFVAVMPFEAPKFVPHPSKEHVIEHADSDWWEEKTEKNFEYIESLRVGSVGLATEITTESITREVSVDELLRVIPFNIVAPQLEQEKKRVIRDNYRALKEHFDVDTLFNWVDVNPTDLAQELHEIEPEIEFEEWEETATRIINGIEECSNATKVQPESPTP